MSLVYRPHLTLFWKREGTSGIERDRKTANRGGSLNVEHERLKTAFGFWTLGFVSGVSPLCREAGWALIAVCVRSFAATA
jgi:hypothetical protein